MGPPREEEITIPTCNSIWCSIPEVTDPDPIEPVISEAIAQAPNTYQIRKGDTLWSLAVRFYGDGHRYPDLLAANRGTLADPSQMTVGSTIVIPN